MKLFREALLERLVAKHAISKELKTKVLGWRQSGLLDPCRRADPCPR